MKFGCCTTYKNYDKLVDYGYDFIELSGFEIYNMTDDEFTALAKKIKNGKIPCLGFNDYCKVMPQIVGESVDSAKTFEYAKILVERGGALGIKSMGIGAPTARILPTGFDKNKADEQCVEFLKIVCREAEKQGINILFEAVHKHMCNYVNYVSDAVEIVKKADLKNLFIVMDFYHMVVMNEDIFDIGYAMPYVKHIHISSIGEKYSREFINEWDIDLNTKILSNLKKFGYNGSVSIEADRDKFKDGAEKSIKILKEIQRTI